LFLDRSGDVGISGHSSEPFDMAKAVVILLVVVEIDGATNASTDGRLLVTDAATAIIPANAAAAAAVGRLTIVVLREYKC